jgi:hypothetical protein
MSNTDLTKNQGVSSGACEVSAVPASVCVQSSLYNEGKNTLVRKEEFMVKQYVSFR